MATSNDGIPQPAERGWQVGKTHSQTNAYMFDNELACDIKFTVHSADGAIVCIPAHKYMLVSRSPVFEAMLCGPGNYIEKSEDVIITDIEPGVFKAVLRYMYTDDLTITAHTVLYLMSAAKKYLLDPLVEKCKEFLTTNMDTDNVCTIFNHSVLQGEDSLVDKCLSFMAAQTRKVLKSESFLELSQLSLETLLRADKLYASEMDIYAACVEWAKPNSKQDTGVNIRETLGKCVFQIRFLSMTSEAFNNAIGFSDILTDKEVRLFNLCINRTIHKQAEDQLKELGFNVCKRKEEQSEQINMIARRINGTDGIWEHESGRSDAIGFQTDHPILLCGVSFFRSMNLGNNHSCYMQIYDGSSGAWVYETYTTLTADGKSNKQQVMLGTPLRLEANKKHAVKALIVGSSVARGYDGAETLTTEGVTFTFLRHDDCTNGTAVQYGQIPELIFQTLH